MYLENDTEALTPLVKSFVLLLFLLVCTTNTYAFVAQDSSELSTKEARVTTELRILTYNVQLLPRLFAPVSRFMRLKQGNRANWIIDYLNDDKDYDVIVFQEVFAKPLCRRLMKKLKDKYPYQVRPQRRKGALLKQGSGLLIMSKYPIIDQELIFFRNGVNYEWIATKGAVWALIEKDGVRFQVIGTHLQSQHKENAQAEREWQLSKIAELAQKHKLDGQPVIFTGDFNVPRSQKEWYGRMLDILKVEAPEINDPRPFTFDQLNDWVFPLYDYEHEQLDYFLFRPNDKNCELLKQAIIRPTKQYKGEEVDLADHYGLEAIFKLSND